MSREETCSHTLCVIIICYYFLANVVQNNYQSVLSLSKCLTEFLGFFGFFLPILFLCFTFVSLTNKFTTMKNS